jgi:pyruvate/2-oxoglutarate/acetoin dehydrogenase E1 component
VFDPRSIFPFDWSALAESLDKTGRLVVFDDGNRYAGFGAEVLATAAEEMRLTAPPRRITRPEAAMVGASPELDPGLLPNRGQLLDAIKRVLK